MLKKVCLSFILLSLSFPLPSFAKIHTEVAHYKTDHLNLQGYLAYEDSEKGRRPAVIVVHEQWGLNDYARGRARKLTELGYVALAIDMYEEGKVATHPQEAGQFARAAKADRKALRKRFEAAYEYLLAQPNTDSNRIAAVGYGFGGEVVLEAARMGFGLEGVVSFYGSLMTTHPAKPAGVRASVLVCHGAEDSLVPEEDIQRFISEMRSAHVDSQFISYENAQHSFTNPDADLLAREFDLPISYNVEADLKSWKDMKRFLEKVFI